MFQRQKPLVLGVELLVVLEDEVDKFAAVNEPEVALAASEALGCGREGA